MEPVEGIDSSKSYGWELNTDQFVRVTHARKDIKLPKKLQSS